MVPVLWGLSKLKKKKMGHSGPKPLSIVSSSIGRLEGKEEMRLQLEKVGFELGLEEKYNLNRGGRETR